MAVGAAWLAAVPARAAVPAILVAIGLAGCEGRGAAPAPPARAPAASPAPADPAAARVRAEKAAGRLVSAVMGELTKALAEGPPEHAVRVCADAAQTVSAKAAAEEGVSMKRTALKLRNPKNAPDDFERRVLEEWAKEGADREPRAEVVPTPEGGRELRFLKPIVLQPLCAACHGPAEEIPAPVRAALAERYPEDRATGFRPGDLRGAVSIRVPLGSGR